MLPALLLFAACTGAPEPPDPNSYPWSISVSGDGSMTAFGLTPRKSTFQDARDRFGDRLEVAMFEADGERALEIFYGKANLNGLQGRLILTLDAPADLLGQIAATATSKPSGAGAIRYALPEDLTDPLPALAIKAMLFAPAAGLSEETIVARFGPPEQRETSEDGTLLLYPSRGVHITVPDGGRELIQFVHPEDFAWLKAHSQPH